ncbi:MAG: SPFH domain-containing protein [Fibrobacteria bacterium]
MGLFDPIRRQLRSVIQWENPGDDELFRKWSDDGDEIKNASKLIANPGQGCIFVYEGKIRNVLDREGMIELDTANIPFWTTLASGMQAFESMHKTGVYFFRKTRILNQKWGTASPIKYEDPEFRFPVALKAYGNFSCQIMEPAQFFLNVSGARDLYSVADLREALLSRLVPVIGELLAGKKLAYIDIDSKREGIAAGALERLAPDFAKLGFAITDFRIEGTDFDEGTKQRIGQISDKLADRNAADRLGITYAELQRLMALREAARNEGGAAGVLLGAGAGAGLERMMTPGLEARSAGGDPPEGALSRLRRLKGMLDEKLISDAEFAAKKQEILKDI